MKSSRRLSAASHVRLLALASIVPVAGPSFAQSPVPVPLVPDAMTTAVAALQPEAPPFLEETRADLLRAVKALRSGDDLPQSLRQRLSGMVIDWRTGARERRIADVLLKTARGDKGMLRRAMDAEFAVRAVVGRASPALSGLEEKITMAADEIATKFAQYRNLMEQLGLEIARFRQIFPRPGVDALPSESRSMARLRTAIGDLEVESRRAPQYELSKKEEEELAREMRRPERSRPASSNPDRPGEGRSAVVTHAPATPEILQLLNLPSLASIPADRKLLAVRLRLAMVRILRSSDPRVVIREATDPLPAFYPEGQIGRTLIPTEDYGKALEKLKSLNLRQPRGPAPPK